MRVVIVDDEALARVDQQTIASLAAGGSLDTEVGLEADGLRCTEFRGQ